jgi:NADH-quinone oxidoreductase subunit H
MAESKRIPFDLPEAENELGAGYHMEYSGMRFGLFFIGEYVHLQVMGALVAVFFLGGWHGPLLPGPVWLLIKVVAVALVMIWIRGTLPRLRYDQLMAFRMEDFDSGIVDQYCGDGRIHSVRKLMRNGAFRSRPAFSLG